MSKKQSLHQKIFKVITMLLFLVSLLIPSQMVAAEPDRADPEVPGDITIIYPKNDAVPNPLETDTVEFVWLQDDPLPYQVTITIEPGGITHRLSFDHGWPGCARQEDGVHCIWELPYALEPGRYTWQIQPEINGTYGNVTAPESFIIPDGNNILGKGVGITPNNTEETNPVTFTWQANPGAARYWLWVDDLTNGPEWDNQWITPADAGCASGSGNCSYTLPVNLTNGNKQWWILAFDAQSGNSGWSTPLSFNVTDNSGGGIPGIGVGISPDSTNESNPVTLTWQADAAAVRYWLWLNHVSNAAIWKEWDNANVTPAEANCASGSGTCSYTLPTSLSDGQKEWWILPIGQNNSHSGWSSPLYFSLNDSGGGGGIPGAGVGISPNGTNESNPVTLTWQADPAAAHYWLWIEILGGGEEWNTSNITPADAGCASGSGACSYTLPVNLTDGDKVWWVLPTGSQGEAVAWSPPLFFSVGGGSGNLPGQGVLISPIETTVSNPVTLTWQLDPMATQYHLVLLKDEDALIDIWLTTNEAGCLNSTNTCSYALQFLENDTYAWRILPSNSAGDGSWSPRTNFTVSGGGNIQVPGKAVGISPNGTNESNPLTMTWQAEPNAAQYWLWIDNLNNNTVPWEGWVTGAEAGCAGQSGTCSFTSPVALNDGDFRWWVLAANDLGYGPWSDPLYFTIGSSNIEVPGNAVALSPNQTTVTNPIVFSWQQFAPLPTHVNLSLQPGNISHRISWDQLNCSQNEDGHECTYSLPYFLSDGNYAWQVQPEINGVYGNQSTSLAFSVRDESYELPGKGVGISPNGTNETNPVTLTWQADPYGARYYLWVNPLDGGEHWKDDTITASQAGCASGTGTCSYNIPITLSSGQYRWWVLPINSQGDYTLWSDPLDFSVGSTVQVPATPIGESPIDISVNNPVIFFWKQAMDNWPTSFQINLTPAASSGAISQTFSESEAVCSPLENNLALCGYTWPSNLANGEYIWQIKAMNSAGSSPMSPNYPFNVDDGNTEVPGKTILIHPVGEAVPNPVTFEWQADPLATEYEITVEAADGYEGSFSLVLSADSANCGSGTGICSYLSETLAEANHIWYVTAKNSAGSGPTSEYAMFTVKDYSTEIPGKGIGISPDNTEETSPITFTWKSDPHATKYELWVENGSAYNWDKWLTASETGCAKGEEVCTYTIDEQMPDGTYTWYILPGNEGEFGTWSDPLGFIIKSTVVKPGSSIPAAPNGSTENNPVTFRWTQNSPLPSHFTLAIKQDGGSEKIIQFKWNDALCVTISGPPSCSYTSSTTLADGSYTWQIRPELDGNLGDWSAKLPFTINDHPLPGKVILISPKNQEVKSPITFTWNADALATGYTLELSMENGGTSTIFITSAEANCAKDTSTCSYTKSLNAGSYAWLIIASNASGDGPASDTAGFTVVASGQLPGQGVGISPDKLKTTNPVTYIWQVDQYATSYNLKVTDLSGKVYLDIILHPSDIECSIGANETEQCSFTATEELMVGISYKWQVLPMNQYGSGEWSPPLNFMVIELK